MKSTVIVISENPEAVNKARSQYESDPNYSLQVYSPTQWAEVIENPSLRGSVSSGTPTLSSGSNSGAKVIAFPGMQNNQSRVEKIEEIEAKAIESAIAQYKGNLTEAAKALGIGRATLYRKVKLYKIDPQAARRKRAA